MEDRLQPDDKTRAALATAEAYHRANYHRSYYLSKDVRMGESSVYIVQAQPCGFIKIGKSGDKPWQRTKGLRNACLKAGQDELNVVLLRSGLNAGDLERMLHKALRHSRMTEHARDLGLPCPTEWFRPLWDDIEGQAVIDGLAQGVDWMSDLVWGEYLKWRAEETAIELR